MGYMTAATTGVILSSGNTVFNEASADKDFRIESDDNTHMLYVDAGNDRVGIGTATPNSALHVSGSGYTDLLTVESTNATANASPDLVLYKNTVGVTGHYLGNIIFRGQDDASNDTEYVQIASYINDAANGAEQGRLQVLVTGTEYMRMGQGGYIVFNETGANIDFRVEGVSEPNLLKIDAGNDRIGIGTGTPLAPLHVVGDLLATSSVWTNDIQVGYGSGPGIIQVYNAGDDLVLQTAPSGGSGNIERMRITEAGLVGIGTATPLAPLHVSDSGAGDTIRLESTDAGTGLGPDLVFKRTTATPVNGDLIGSIRFLSMNSNQDDGAGTEAEHEFADIYARVNDITTGSESGELYFRTFMGGTQRKRLGLTLTETVFNQDGQDINLRIEGSGAPNALFVEGSSGNIGLGTATPASTLDVIGDVRFRASVEVCTSDPAAANIETGTVYQFTKGSAGVFTLPASPPVGTQFVLVNGDGQDIVITRPHASVKINGATSNVTNTTAYAATSIIATVSNGNSSEWLVFGGI